MLCCRQLAKRDISLRQLSAELGNSRQQCREAIEENGRLESRIQAFTYSAQSEQDLLASEVKHREDAINKLKNQQIQLQETIGKQEEKVAVPFTVACSVTWINNVININRICKCKGVHCEATLIEHVLCYDDRFYKCRTF